MSIRAHGDMTVAHARREALAEDIAELTGLGVRTVRNRLDAIHGKTRLRVAFAEWPPPSIALARITTAAAQQMDIIEEIAAVTDLNPRQVRGRMNRVHGKTLVGTLFSAEWSNIADGDLTAGDDDDEEEDDGDEEEDDDVDDLEQLTVADARRHRLAGAIADRTGVGVRSVRARLAQAHGNALVSTVFAEEWNGGDEEDEEEDEDEQDGVTGRRPVGRSRPGGIQRNQVVNERYRLLKKLGEGGFGEAFEARDEQFPERGVVVLKFAAFDTLANEFKMATKLRHDNICQYFDIGFDGKRNRRFLVIEHGGRSLERLIRDDGALDKRDAIAIVRQAAAALDYAHSKGVIHHDVSPGNILIDEHGHVRVTDFGISVAATMRTVAGGNRTMVAQTMLGRHPCYAAPEMTSGAPVGRRADQYSLALVLCSLLEGEVSKKPYKMRDFQRLSAKQNAGVRRALSARADDRFPSCVAFLDAIAGG
jgi:hypothetical protein